MLGKRVCVQLTYKSVIFSDQFSSNYICYVTIINFNFDSGYFQELPGALN